MKAVLDSIQPVIRNSRSVSINEEAIDGFIASLTEGEFHQAEFDPSGALKSQSDEEMVGFVILYNTINFCYWGEPKWTIEIDGKQHDGSDGLTQALMRGIKEGYQLLNPEYLASLSEKDFKTILRGNVDIPLFKERLDMLRELGALVQEKFNGTWMAVIEKGKRDVVGIVETLVNEFPNLFRDEADYNGHTVKFYKRAQLVPAFLAHDLPVLGLTSLKLSNADKLTAFADYKVPQLLRKFDILVYTDDLATKIDNFVEIPEGSDEEIEIRAHTIEAVERVAKKAKQTFPMATPAKIDGILWFRGQKKSSDDKPYHRTLTIWY